MAARQRATAVYFIDKYALRVGGEKDTTEEADTVGCCSLRHEHITLREPNLVTFDFLGKDSIRFYQPDKEVDPQVFKNLKLFKKGSKTGDDLFDRVKVGIRRLNQMRIFAELRVRACSLPFSMPISPAS